MLKKEYGLFLREGNKGLYGMLLYFLAKMISDTTTSVVFLLIHMSVVYFTTNLWHDIPLAFLTFLLVFYISITTAQVLGMQLSVALPTLQIALLITPTINIFFMIMGGFYIPLDNFPGFIK